MTDSKCFSYKNMSHRRRKSKHLKKLFVGLVGTVVNGAIDPASASRGHTQKGHDGLNIKYFVALTVRESLMKLTKHYLYRVPIGESL